MIYKRGNTSAIKKGIRIADSDEVEIRIAIATDYWGKDPHHTSLQHLYAIKNNPYDRLLQDHIAEHQRLFRRVALNLIQTKDLFATSVQGLDRKMWETDANLGCASAISEMLVQSHAGFIHLLPALPTALPDGNVKGLRTIGGFEVALEWKDGAIHHVTIRSINGNPCSLKYDEKEIEFLTEKGQEYRFDGSLIQR